MTTITLDPTKTPSDFTARTPRQFDRTAVAASIAHTAKLKPEQFVTGKLPGTVYHANYLAYLEFCWAYDHSPVLTPDILWFTLLSEIAGVIRENPEAVRALFSTEPGKQRILVPTGDPTHLPLDLIIDQLRDLVPSGTDNYLPTFTTTTDASRFACYAAFADAVSPYYSYGTYLCGFPSIHVHGTVDDYVKVAEAWRKLPALFSGRDPKYFAGVQKTLEDLVVALEAAQRDTRLSAEKAHTFFKGFFRSVKCGSGSQVEIDGWFVRLFRKQPDGPRYSGNFDSHVARVEYECLDTKQTFVMLYGLFSSTLADGAATPEFSPLIYETTSGKKPKPVSRDSVDAAAMAVHAIKTRHGSHPVAGITIHPTITTEWSTKIPS